MTKKKPKKKKKKKKEEIKVYRGEYGRALERKRILKSKAKYKKLMEYGKKKKKKRSNPVALSPWLRKSM